jgi:PAS domain S-box-containing protein
MRASGSNDFAAQRKSFLARMEGFGWFVGLFDHLPDVYLFVKDREGRFVLCNRALLGLFGVRHEDELLGCRDPDFFPPDLCEIYARDDGEVMRRGQPLIDKLELIRKADGTLQWHSTSKFPVRDRAGRVIGVGGMNRDLNKMHATSAPFMSMAPAMEAILNDYAERLSVRDLARRTGLSVSQFERRFRKKFHTTPSRYLLRVRLDAACQLLVQTDRTIAAIAADTGFCDQSHFTHRFVREKGTTPSRYRRDYSGS